MEVDHKEKAACMNAGCSAVSWETMDGKHLWGRNFDFNRLAKGTNVFFIPAKTPYQICPEEEPTGKGDRERKTIYGIIGIGVSLSLDCPIFYEGMNEEGLMGGQLYYREFADFSRETNEERTPVAPPLLVTYLLATCGDVGEVAREMKENIQLAMQPIFGSVPPLHWMFTDKQGRSIVIESRKEGLFLYEDAMGVLTNSPGYDWHCTNLLNYMHIRDEDYGKGVINSHVLNPCFSGSGALGLPGDCSSPSRFVRLAFLKEYMQKGRNEEEGVVGLFHMMGHVSFPAGLVKVGQIGEITEIEEGLVPYDYTVYTAVMCAESLSFYWTTYENQQIRCVDMRTLLQDRRKREFPLKEKAEFCRLS